MKKLQYSVMVGIDMISQEDGESIDFRTETKYYDTLEQARKKAEGYHVGDVIGRYGDGTKCVISAVEISEELEEVDVY